MTKTEPVVVLGAGLAGCSAALELAQAGHRVILLDRTARPMLGASRHNEGKLHLGYVYAADYLNQTHPILASGSLRFLQTVARLTQSPEQMQVKSDAFTYIVPEDSARPATDLWDYLQRVDATVADLCGRYGRAALPASRPLPAAALRQHYSDRIVAGFQTPEIAVDPGRVADIVSAAVYAHPLIEFRGATTVLGARPAAAGGFGIDLETSGARFGLAASGVINALWEDQSRVDAMIGLASAHLWSRRWKATVTIDLPAREEPMPSTTAFVGPFGDFVLYGGDRIYLSWYPACRLAMSTTATPDDIRAKVATIDPQAIRAATLRGMATLLPGVAGLKRHEARTRIGGGFIMAIGDRDIDKSDSGFHHRHQIGVESLGNWISVSTGKFCTAPMFGSQAAEALRQRVR